MNKLNSSRPLVGAGYAVLSRLSIAPDQVHLLQTVSLQVEACWVGTEAPSARCKNSRTTSIPSSGSVPVDHPVRGLNMSSFSSTISNPSGPAISDTQAAIAESDSSSAVAGHELTEIDLTAIGRELLEKLDLRLKEMLIGTEGTPVSKKEPIC